MRGRWAARVRPRRQEDYRACRLLSTGPAFHWERQRLAGPAVEAASQQLPHRLSMCSKGCGLDGRAAGSAALPVKRPPGISPRRPFRIQNNTLTVDQLLGGEAPGVEHRFDELGV